MSEIALLGVVGITFVALNSASKMKDPAKAIYTNDNKGCFMPQANRNRKRLEGEHGLQMRIEGARINHGRADVVDSSDRDYYKKALRNLWADDADSIYLQSSLADYKLRHHDSILTGYADRPTIILNTADNN